MLIDADAVVREVQERGSPVLAELAERFGPQVLTAEGDLDRAAVAGIVFNETLTRWRR